MNTNNTPDLRTALIEARDWFESQAKAVSKGCGSSYELHDLRVQRDALDAALTAQAQTVAHDALRCAVGNCKFNGKVDKHATGCSAAASNEEALLKALTEATRSLETIQLMAGKDDYLQDMAQVRAYATSRAMAANTAIAAFEDAPAQPVPASVITASVMRDDGGEQQAFCLMVAYRAEKDAMTALAMLTDEPAQPAAPTQAGELAQAYSHADVTAAHTEGYKLGLAQRDVAPAQAAPIEVTDEMALAFHHAISDSSIGQDDVDDTKTGLRAALANFTLCAQAAQALIDSAPAPFRRLGELLASTLDEDHWATAQSLLLGGLVAAQGCVAASQRMDSAMQDGVNVHGAMSVIIGATEGGA